MVWALAAVWLAGCDLAGVAGPAAADARPGRLVILEDGRKLNLACAGHGSPTVILESGFGAGTGAWRKVQPTLARTTRVCAYDRAGSGYSDPGPLPRDGAAIARDLDQALRAAKVRGPFIVVGHSAGALYGRLFAARRPEDVAGLVLLDPTVEHRAAQPAGDGLDGIRRRTRRCLAAAAANPQPPVGDARWTGCIAAKAGAHAIAVAQRPETWRSQLSELDNIFGRTSDQVFRIGAVLRTVPLYILTASDTAASAPSYGFDAPQSVIELQHQLIARTSEAGSQQTILSSHMVMSDRPQIVISAVEDMIRASRAGLPPPPRPGSETEPTEDPFKLPEPEDDPLQGATPPAALPM